jgi:hypothetical protein
VLTGAKALNHLRGHVGDLPWLPQIFSPIERYPAHLVTL